MLFYNLEDLRSYMTAGWLSYEKQSTGSMASTSHLLIQGTISY